MSTTRTRTNDGPQETAAETLARIENGFSKNDLAVVMMFANLGVNPDDIDPRRNVLTFKAWKAKGRKVAKGATSISVPVYVPAKGKGEVTETKADGTSEKTAAFVIKRHARLFHESQTLEADAPKGTRPAALFNPYLIKIEKDDIRSYYDVTADEIKAEAERFDEQRKQQQAEQDERTAEAIEEQGGTFEVEQVATDDAPEAPETPAEPSTPPAVLTIEHKPEPAAAAEPELLDEMPADVAAAACTCPMPGYMTNVNCPLHGNLTKDERAELRKEISSKPKQRQLALI